MSAEDNLSPNTTPEPGSGALPPKHDPAAYKPSEKELSSFKRTGRRVLLVVLLVLGCGLTYGAWRYYENYRAVMATAEQRKDFVPTLRVATVKASPETIQLTLPATTLAYTQANIYARVSGYISKRKVDIGDRVKKGDLLVEIYAPEIEYQLAQAEATLAQTKATLQQNVANMQLAEITDQRNSPLVQRGFVSALSGDTYRLNVDAENAQVAAAQANVLAQEAQVKVMRQQMFYQQVVAPFDGVITQRNVNIGDLVQGDLTTGTTMFTIMHSDVIRTQVYVPQNEAFGLTDGVKTNIHVPNLPGKVFPGKVTRVADALAPDTRTLLTEIDIPNPDGVLTPGTYCTVELFIPRKTPSLIIPSQAIIFDENGMQVAVVKSGRANIQTVNVTRDMGTSVEVDHGVEAGDYVVLDPPVDLANGQKVKMKKPMQQASAE